MQNKSLIIHLNLIKRWFDMIGDPKVEGYREIKPYWNNRFVDGKVKINGKFYSPQETEILICFSNGYSADRPQKTFRLVSINIQEGKEEWGALPGQKYHTLHIQKL